MIPPIGRLHLGEDGAGRWPEQEDAALSASIFGTVERARAVAEIEAWASLQGFSGAAVAEIEMSVGAGVTIEMPDGKRAFIKVWPASFDPVALAAQMQLQKEVRSAGFPAPEVLTSIRPLALGSAAAMSYERPGHPADARDPLVRRAMAENLARLTRQASEFAALTGLPRLGPPPANEAWPKSHNVLFDFAATKAGAEWVDDIALAALARLRQPVGRVVISHNDWSAKNMRMAGHEVAMVYDWDSVMAGPETLFLGTAAAHFP